MLPFFEQKAKETATIIAQRLEKDETIIEGNTNIHPHSCL
jgi:hypothetical protein